MAWPRLAGIGADPEFVIQDRVSGKIRAPHYIVYDPDPHNNAGQASAIGVDGARPTSSIEFRPGIASSGEELINRLADLVLRLRLHYHPKKIRYRAGAWVDPEPLGGHIHLSWEAKLTRNDSKFANYAWVIHQIVNGLKAQSDFLIPKLFSENEVVSRVHYAVRNRRDFASDLSTRPPNLEEIIAEGHLEYRYPPSWLDTPEAAYCFLGGAEVIAKIVEEAKLGTEIDWRTIIDNIYVNGGIRVAKGPSLAEALGVAVKFIGPDDFTDNWIG